MEKGLTSKEAHEKLVQFGKNEIKAAGKKSAFSIFISQFPTVINAILLIAAILSFFLSDLIDCVFIVAVLTLNGVFGFVQEYRAERSLEKLKNFVKPRSRAIRNGEEIEIETVNIVPGDLVVLCEGDRIPADGVLALARHIEVDESILTGESLPVIKKENDLLLKGTLISKGRGSLLVQKTGMETRFGQIAQKLSSLESEKTPLQKQLDGLGKNLSFVVIFFSFLLIPIGLVQDKSLFPIILIAISIAIAAIPEGLPAVVTIALAIGTNRMAKKQAIVRKMSSVETLGSVQIILTDKTGTLTQNKMQVKKSFVFSEKSLDNLVLACVLGNTASLIEKSDGETPAFDVVGDKTDGAFLLWLKEQKKNLEELKSKGKILDEYVFDPLTKTVTVVWDPSLRSGQNKEKHVFVRGAPERLIEISNLKDKEKERIESLFKKYAKEGLRVIAFGHRKLPPDHANFERMELEKNLEFLGFLGIYDPPRIEVKTAIQNAKIAGIKTIMVTGDNDLTALSIAKEIGLIEKDEDVVTGDELSKIPDEELKSIILKTRIFARVKPEDKLRLVNLFKNQGLIVGVTGDGVNDALALKRADVGIAMGETGTDVAKEASDIILINDNYSTLVAAILEGRTIYNNIVRAITYLLSGNLSEISLIFLAAILGMPNPLLPTQILWINLVTDVFPALALASEEKDLRVLKHPPRDPKMPILNKERLFFIAIWGFSLAIFLLFIFRIIPNQLLGRTLVFNLLIFAHLIIAFIVRGKIPTPNRNLFIVAIGTICIQIAISTTPFFQQIFHLGF